MLKCNVSASLHGHWMLPWDIYGTECRSFISSQFVERQIGFRKKKSACRFSAICTLYCLELFFYYTTRANLLLYCCCNRFFRHGCSFYFLGSLAPRNGRHKHIFGISLPLTKLLRIRSRFDDLIYLQEKKKLLNASNASVYRCHLEMFGCFISREFFETNRKLRDQFPFSFHSKISCLRFAIS